MSLLTAIAPEDYATVVLATIAEQRNNTSPMRREKCINTYIARMGEDEIRSITQAQALLLQFSGTSALDVSVRQGAMVLMQADGDALRRASRACGTVMLLADEAADVHSAARTRQGDIDTHLAAVAPLLA